MLIQFRTIETLATALHFVLRKDFYKSKVYKANIFRTGCKMFQDKFGAHLKV